MIKFLRKMFDQLFEHNSSKCCKCGLYYAPSECFECRNINPFVEKDKQSNCGLSDSGSYYYCGCGKCPPQTMKINPCNCEREEEFCICAKFIGPKEKEEAKMKMKLPNGTERDIQIAVSTDKCTFINVFANGELIIKFEKEFYRIAWSDYSKEFNRKSSGSIMLLNSSSKFDHRFDGDRLDIL